MNETKINLAQPIIDDEMISEAERVLNDEFFLRGDSVEAFERDFAEYVETEHAVSVDSGTRALEFALRSLDIDENDIVITAPASFIATANAIIHAGATPAFVDVSLDTYTIDLNLLEQKVEELESAGKTIGAVVPVHLYGYPVNVEAIRKVVGDIPIVTDACQAHGASFEKTKVGKAADVAGFSFYPSKNMTVAGDGGMVTTDNDEIAKKIRQLRDVGRGDGEYEHEAIGYTARLPTIAASIGNIQLDRLDDWNNHRKGVARQYTDELSGVGDLSLPPLGDDHREPAWYLYVIRSEQRDSLAKFLDERGIETGIHYGCPIHLQEPYKKRGWESGEFPRSEQWAEEVLSLPIHPGLEPEDVSYITDNIKSFFEQQ